MIKKHFTLSKLTGGYMVDDGDSGNGYTPNRWAFSTLAEALEFIKAEMDKEEGRRR